MRMFLIMSSQISLVNLSQQFILHNDKAQINSQTTPTSMYHKERSTKTSCHGSHLSQSSLTSKLHSCDFGSGCLSAFGSTKSAEYNISSPRLDIASLWADVEKKVAQMTNLPGTSSGARIQYFANIAQEEQALELLAKLGSLDNISLKRSRICI